MARSYIAEPNHYWIPIDNGEWFCSCRWRPNYYSGPSIDEQVANHKLEVDSGQNTFVAVPCKTCKGKGFKGPTKGHQTYCFSCQGTGVES